MVRTNLSNLHNLNDVNFKFFSKLKFSARHVAHIFLRNLPAYSCSPYVKIVHRMHSLQISRAILKNEINSGRWTFWDRRGIGTSINTLVRRYYFRFVPSYS